MKINHLAEAKYHLRQMSYGEFMTIIKGALNSNTSRSSETLRIIVANRLWKWVQRG